MTAAHEEKAASKAEESPEVIVPDEGPSSSAATPASASGSSGSPGAVPGLTLDQAVAAEKEALDRMKTIQMRMALTSVKIGGNLSTRWQQMIGILFSAQLQSIDKLGFSQDQLGIMQYTAHLQSLSNSNAALKKLADAKWDYAIEQAFGITEQRPMKVEKAREFVNEMVTRISAPALLKRVDAIVARVGEVKDAETGMKLQQELFPLMFETQLEVSAAHGYTGDEGYVLGQRALMEHSQDTEVATAMAQLQMGLLKRAGIEMSR